MDKNAVIEIVRRLGQELEARGIGPLKVILFGSQLSGAAVDGSDIDVVVVSESFNGKGYWERVRILTDAIYAVFAPIEAVAMTPEEWAAGDSMIVDFARDGEVLYAA